MEMLQGDKFPSEITQANLDEFLSKEPKFPKLSTKIHDTTPVQEFLSGKNCLTGVSITIICVLVQFKIKQFVHRARDGGNTNFATVAMCVNFISIKVVRHP